MPKKRSNRPEVEGLIPDVDEEIQGGASDAENETDGKNQKSTSRQDDIESNRQDDKSILAQQLEVLMGGPDSPFERELPELNARANGYLSGEVEEALQQATSVLKNKFEGVSKSLIMNYAIRLALWELRENADQSRLVEWLDEVSSEKEQASS